MQPPGGRMLTDDRAHDTHDKQHTELKPDSTALLLVSFIGQCSYLIIPWSLISIPIFYYQVMQYRNKFNEWICLRIV